jgi:hypothetical protein
VQRRWYSLALAAAVSCGGAYAHHSIGSVYDSTRQVTVEGRVTEFQFVNPHPILIIDAATESPPAQPWRLEMDNRFELSEIGMSADTFKQGDRVVVTGSMSRTEPQSLYIRRLDRPIDGFRYEQVGSRPTINVRRER